jgi:anti-sigma factor RsiW
MHEPVIESLEEILRGDTPAPSASAHLSGCDACRRELAAMVAQNDLFRALRLSEPPEPSPGFYARVINRVETQTRPSVWSVFGDSLFARRLTYASMTLLVLLGTVFMSSEMRSPVLVNGPETIIANDDQYQTVSNNPERDRSTVLVQLATYEE